MGAVVDYYADQKPSDVVDYYGRKDSSAQGGDGGPHARLSPIQAAANAAHMPMRDVKLHVDALTAQQTSLRALLDAEPRNNAIGRKLRDVERQLIQAVAIDRAAAERVVMAPASSEQVPSVTDAVMGTIFGGEQTERPAQLPPRSTDTIARPLD
jgi:hypothetical protein